MAEEGKIQYSVELNISGLERQADQAGKAFDRIGQNASAGGRKIDQSAEQSRRSLQLLGKEAQAQSDKIDSAFTGAANKIGKAMALMGVAAGVQEFGSKVMQVRGEFQKLEVAFEVMLGSAEKADELMNQLVQTASTTPFDLQGVANGAKQLLAYGTSADKVNETLVRLGDIASGLSIPLNDLVMLYGTTQTQGRLFTQDLRQFMGRGLPLVRELAKQFGVTESKVGELVTAGKVGFPQVQKAIESLTNEGGQFAGLMEKQSKTISGQISNLEDSIDMMFNNIGKSSEGLISGALGAVNTLIENYEKVGEALFYVIEAVGAYKAALIAVAIVQRANNALIAQAALEKKLAAAAGVVLSDAEATAAAKTKLLELAQMRLTKALKTVTAATLKNPYVLFAAAVVAATIAIRRFIKARSEEERVQRKINEIKKEAAVRLEEEKDKINNLIDVAKDENASMKARESAINSLNKIIPNYNAQLDATSGKYKENKAALDDYLVSLAKKYELEGAKDQLAQIGKEIAQTRVQIAEAEKNAEGAKNLQGKVGQLSAYNATESQFLTANTQNANARLNSLNKDLQIQLKQRQLIYDTFGKDLKGTADTIKETEDNIPPSDKPKKTGTKKDDRLKREEEIADAILDLRKDNAQKIVDIEEDETRQKLAQYGLDRENRMKEIERTHDELVKKRGGNLTPEEEEAFTEARILAQQEYAKKVSDLNKERKLQEQSDMNDYLTRYGTYEEKRKAIAEKYQAEIAKAQSEGMKKSLQKQMEQELSDLDMEELRKSIDWEDTFADMTNHSIRYLELLRDKLREALNAKEITEENAKVLSDKINEITRQIDSKGNIWENFLPGLQQRKSLERLLKLAQKQGNTQQAASIEDRLEGLGGIKDIFAFAGGSPMEIMQGINQNVQSLGDLVDTIGVGNTEFGEAVHSFAEGTNSFMGAVQSLASGDIFGAANGIIKGFQSYGRMLGIGNGSNAKEVAEITEKNTESNKMLTESVNRLKESMDKANGASAVEIYDEAMEDQKRIISQQMEILKAQMGYHGAHHSNAYYFNLSKDYYKQISQLLGKNITDLSSIYELTPEEMDKIRTSLTDVWASILSQGKYDKSEYWENYADLAGKVEQLTEQISENLTQTSFSNVRDEFVSALMDMETDAADFADDFSEYMMRALLNAKIGDVLDNELQSWYDDWAQTMKANGGQMSSSDLQKYKDGWNAIVQQGIEIRDNLADLTGYKDRTGSSASGSTGSWQSMGQDTAEELNGRFTALQINSERMIEIMIGNREILQGMALERQESGSALLEMNQLVITCSDLLTRIAKNSDALPNISERLDQIKRNTDRL